MSQKSVPVAPIQREQFDRAHLSRRVTRKFSSFLFESRAALVWQLFPGLMLMVWLFLVPLVYIVLISFWQFSPGYFGPTTLTIENYAKLLGDEFYLAATLRTIWLGVQVSTICMLMGYPFALILARSDIPGKSWLLFLMLTPLFVSGVVRSFGWVILLARQGPISRWVADMNTGLPRELLNTDYAVVIGLVSAFIPFMVTATYSSLVNIPNELIEAAQVMGARPIAVFTRLIVPLSIPGLLSGWLLVFALTISAYVQPAVLGGPAFFVLATIIYQQLMSVLNWQFASAAAMILLLLSLGLTYLPQRLLQPRIVNKR